MPVDNCPHTFEELAQSVLPAHLKRLQAATPLLASELVGFRSASKAALARLSRPADFPGCYVFLEEGRPFYVGISRTVVKRLIQHLNFESHFTASLVFRMARQSVSRRMRRNEAMRDAEFLQAFRHAQGRLQKMSVQFVEIENDLVLYMFEVFAAMKLGTDGSNSFRTH